MCNIPPDPPPSKRSQNMTMRNNQHIPRRGFLPRFPNCLAMEAITDLFDQLVASLGDLLRGPSTHQPHSQSHRRISMNILATGTPISPDIPIPFSPCLPLLMNRLTRQSLVVTIVPLPYSLINLDISLSSHILILVLALLLPRKLLSASKVQQFKSSLRTFPRRDVSTTFTVGWRILVEQRRAVVPTCAPGCAGL